MVPGVWPDLESTMARANSLAPSAGVPIVYSQVWYSLLNGCWKVYYAKNEFTPGEALLLDRQTDAITRKTASLVFGRPQMKWSDTVVEIHKRLLSEREAVLVLEAGGDAAWLREIREVGYDGSQILTIQVTLLGSKLAYRGDGVVRLQWPVVPEFSFTGQDTLRLKLKRGYEAKKSVDIYSVGQPVNSKLNALDVIFQPYNYATAMALQYVSTSVAAGEGQAPALAGLPDSRGVDDVTIFLFSQLAFPEVGQGQPPYDEAWIPSLVFPPPQLKRENGSYDKISKVYGTEYFSPREQFSSAEGAQPLKVALSLDPLVRVIANGEGKQPVLLQPGPDLATWVLEGDRLGRVDKEGSARYYYPPAKSEAEVVLEANNKTNRPAAVISSVPKRFTVDVVKATQGGESACATFAVYYAPVTHYFKVSLAGGKFKLTFCFYSPDTGKEVQVEASDTEWAIASGNGSVSSTGVFSPATSNPSPFTVVWARDTTSDRLLYWAFTVIPIPLYSSAEAVALFQS
ncbi:hypothetical protein ASF02_28550 [Pseudomonas sp. Leaf58]|nr:hypothetical protein ASF02_28550 [Pseudomonas sp. Leaf58]